MNDRLQKKWERFSKFFSIDKKNKNNIKKNTIKGEGDALDKGGEINTEAKFLARDIWLFYEAGCGCDAYVHCGDCRHAYTGAGGGGG
ncbi:MAG: hypothetical protein K2I76_02935 [Malacoplasma sp.]|nr:hypothetical protein [Malacoplasma sp.]